MVSPARAAARKSPADVARLAAGRRPSLYAGRMREGPRWPRGSAPPDAASAAGTEAAAVAVSRATLGEPGTLLARAPRELLGVLVDRADREVDAALPVHLGDLDLHVLADLDGIFDVVDTLVGDLGDPDQAFLAGEVLDERADGHDPGDLALEDLADLGLLGEALDHRAGLLAALRLGAGDADRPIVLDLDVRARLGLDRADHLATGTDDVADLVGIDLHRVDARREPVQLGPRLVDDLTHLAEDEQACLAGLGERLTHDLERDALHLDVHLERRDALVGTADLEVHVAVVVLEALDVGEHGVAALLEDQTHRDAADHRLDRHAAVHERERRAAGGGHRRRAVGLERLAHDADRVGELLLRRDDRADGALDERPVTDLAPSCATHHPHFADRVRREVVVGPETPRVHRREGGEELLAPRRAARHDPQSPPPTARGHRPPPRAPPRTAPSTRPPR